MTPKEFYEARMSNWCAHCKKDGHRTDECSLNRSKPMGEIPEGYDGNYKLDSKGSAGCGCKE